MRKGLLLFVFWAFMSCWSLSYAAELQKPVKVLPSTPSATPAPKILTPVSPKPGVSPTPVPSMLTVNAPGNGENWALGSKHDITWTSANVSGYVRLDLCRGGTDPQNRVGTITTNTWVTNGKYTWEAGKYLGGTVPTHGKDYRIVIKADNPSITKSSAPFNLTVAAEPDIKKVMIPSSVRRIALTYPRRGDGLHKGISYKITWNALNLLKDATLVIEILNSQGTTVLHSVGDLQNTGEASFGIPMTLPDERTLYRMRIRTTDTAPETGAQSEMIAIYVAKGAVPAGPPSLKVTNPKTGDRAVGDTVPVKWTTTVSCSGNGGPMDDGFRVELMNEQGSAKVMDLTDTGSVFDSEGPTGVLNWHWDWNIPGGPQGIQPGTYRIKVTSLMSPAACKNISEPFGVIGGLYVFRSKPAKICYHLLAWDPPQPGTFSGALYVPNTLDKQLQRAFGLTTQSSPFNPSFRAPVGLYYYINVNNTFERNEFVIRSNVTFNDDPYWHKNYLSQSHRLASARLVMVRQYKHPDGNYSPCLAGVAKLNGPPVCQGPTSYPVPSQPPSYPWVNVSGQENIQIDLTQHYHDLIQQGKPDYGIMLIPGKEQVELHSACSQPICIQHNLETYDVYLHVYFEKK